jgi:hypothetical protein
MAVSQTGRMKNPCRLRMQNSPIADWLPGSAPAMPGTLVMAGHCDLLPGIRVLAIRPGTTHAMMPVTGSFVGDQVAHAVSGHED